MSSSQQLLLGEGAGGGGPVTYIEDVFSTWLYTGTGATLTITNGIDLATKGGLFWGKSRSTALGGHGLVDTVRGKGSMLQSNTDAAPFTTAGNEFVTSFNTTGVTIGNDNTFNRSGATTVGWTFAKQPKFFDIVTYTGNGSTRTVAHNLGSVPGCIIIKRTNSSADWNVYHQSLGNTKYAILNSGGTPSTSSTRWDNTTPTDSVFTLGTAGDVNGSGNTYVAYLFAHDAGGFGLTGTDNVITCGSFTTSASSTFTVNLGYEPQWILIKPNDTGSWIIVDNMRGWPVGGNSARLFPNNENAEASTSSQGDITATGFQTPSGTSGYASNTTYIYIAIRRGPMKTPTVGTSVFTPVTVAVSSTPSFTSNSVPDLVPVAYRPGSASDYPTWSSRLTGNTFLTSSSTTAENSSNPTIWAFNGQKTFGSTFVNSVAWMLSRAPGFFDVVCYTGTGSATTQTHNLQTIPQLMIVRARAGADWQVYSASLANTQFLVLNATDAVATSTTRWNSTTPTSSVFSLGTSGNVNGSGSTYVAYLFATCAGVSKVGSYTGTGATQTISCGFTGGARFVLIKRTNSTGDWYVWDTARGMVAGTDPYIFLNSTAIEVNTNSVYTTTGGFQIVSTAAGINASGGSYIFLAIA